MLVGSYLRLRGGIYHVRDRIPRQIEVVGAFQSIAAPGSSNIHTPLQRI